MFMHRKYLFLEIRPMHMEMSLSFVVNIYVNLYVDE
jgi:hypothetical protein